eukprot:709294-Rhodomonas_salina.3
MRAISTCKRLIPNGLLSVCIHTNLVFLLVTASTACEDIPLTACEDIPPAVPGDDVPFHQHFVLSKQASTL